MNGLQLTMKQHSSLYPVWLELQHGLSDHFKQLILFGSRARGDFSADSDYDCLVIVDEVTPKVKDLVDDLSAHFLLEHGVVLSIIPVAESLYQQQLYEPLFINVRREGLVW